MENTQRLNQYRAVREKLEIARLGSRVAMGHPETGESTLIPTLTPSPFAGPGGSFFESQCEFFYLKKKDE